MNGLTKWDPFKDWDPFRELNEFQVHMQKSESAKRKQIEVKVE